jgi:hypothetical protein
MRRLGRFSMAKKLRRKKSHQGDEKSFMAHHGQGVIGPRNLSIGSELSEGIYAQIS